MVAVLPTSRVFWRGDALSAMYEGDTKIWEPEVQAWAPDAIPGLTIWLDASQLTPGADVTTWENNGSGADPSFIGSPAPKVRGNALNGKPVVQFKVNEAKLRMTNTGSDLNWTVIYVGRMANTYVGRIVTSQYPPSNLLIGFWNGFEDVAYVEGFLQPDTRKAQTQDWRTYTATGEGVPGDARTWFYEDGEYLGGGQPNSQNGGGWKGFFNINGYAPLSNEETCDCEVAEVLFYDHRLTDVERSEVEDYLFQKWFVAPPLSIPESVPGLGLWLEADHITDVANGAAVTTWPDQGPNHYTVTPMSPGPTWGQSDINGKPSVRFTATQRLNIAGWGTALSGKSEYTLFHVINAAEMGTHPVILTAPTYDIWGFIFEYAPGGGLYWGQPNGYYNQYDAQVPLHAPQILTCSLALPGAGGPKLYKNSVQVTSFANPGSGPIQQTVPNVGADVYLGGYYNNGLGITGNVAAVLWYDRFLIDSERQQIENYLKTKYGIA